MIDPTSDKPIPADAYAEPDEDTDDFIDVNPDSGLLPPEPQEKTPAEPKTEEPKQEPTPEPEPKDPPTEPAAKEPAAQEPVEPKEDPFSFYKTDDKGNETYDMSRATEFLKANQPKQEDAKFPIQEPVKPEDPAPVNNMLENLLDPLRLAEEYAQQNGGDYAAAMRLAEQQVRQRVDKYDQSKEIQQLREEVRADKQDATNERELARLEPKAQTNLFNIAQNGKWGNSKNLVEQVNSKEGTGNFLVMWHKDLNKDKTWPSKEAYLKDYQDWFTRKSADANWLNEAARLTANGVLMHQGHFKNTVKTVRDVQTRDTRNKQKATTRGPAPINRNQRNTKAEVNSFDAYMNRNPYADKT